MSVNNLDQQTLAALRAEQEAAVPERDLASDARERDNVYSGFPPGTIAWIHPLGVKEKPPEQKPFEALRQTFEDMYGPQPEAPAPQPQFPNLMAAFKPPGQN